MEEEREKAIKEENKKIFYLRMLVDLTTNILYQSNLPLSEALELVKSTKEAALKLFPEKEGTYEIIYQSRFNRILKELYGYPKEEV
ncbi:MAG: hypothetical protein J7L64_07720 [Acidobacteria bacterium]|nr:hypothetical protein [Acidobacteriota bacterium]